MCKICLCALKLRSPPNGHNTKRNGKKKGEFLPAAPRPAPGATPGKPAPSAGEAVRLARSIEAGLGKIPEVESSTVVVTGNRALAGVRLKPGLAGEKARQVLDRVAQRAKQVGRRIDRVYVTNDEQMRAKIGSIAQGVRKGKPISGYADEINRIQADVTPR